MKKLFIIAAALLFSNAVLAQSSTKDAQAIQKKIERSDATIADAKKAANANAWIERAGVMIDAANAYTKQLIAGLPVAQMLLPTALGDPKEIEDVKIGTIAMSKYVYENFDMYVSEEGLIQFWDTKNELFANPFSEALNSLKKAKELNAKDFTNTGRGVQAVDRFVKESATVGGNLYALGRYAAAGKLFYEAFEASELKGAIDSSLLLNSGICYLAGGESQTALEKFEKLLSFGSTQNGMTYKHIADCYVKLEQTDKAIEIYKKAFEINPSNLEIIGGMIDAYIAGNKNPEIIIELLKKAQALAPTNAVLFQVEGEIWNKIGNRTKAIEASMVAQKLDPAYFAAFFNEAMYRLYESDAVVEKANKLDINDTKTYDAMMEQVKTLRLDAITALEKAYQIDPASNDVITVLPQIYYVCRDYGDDVRVKYDEFIKKHPQQK